MGRIREFTEEEASLSEALIITTMCIVGFPVEVHVKDGSIFSGIFHSASFDFGYGIALKKVRMVKKGTHKSNVVNGALIDTLVVRPGDLVQVLAKGVMLPTDSDSSDATTCDGGAVPETCGSFQDSDNGAASGGEQLNQQRSEEEVDYHHASELIKELIEVNHASATLNCVPNKRISHDENQAVAAPNQLTYGSVPATGTSPNFKVTNQLHNEEPFCSKSVTSEVSGSDKIGSDAYASSSVVLPSAVSPRNPVTNKTAKESKLNPGAKIFSPSLSNFRSNPTPVPTVSSLAYVPNIIPAVPIAAPQPGVGFRPVAPLSSLPVKVVPYVTSVPATADNGFQYSQPIASHVATRKQPVRHGAAYQPLQAVPSYLHANHQNGMFGRSGQLVYVHPITHDVIQGSATFSQAPHPLLTSHPIHVPKHEGLLADQAFQASVAPPLIPNGQQQFMMPSHQFLLPQPRYSSPMHSIPIPGTSTPYSGKFP